MEFRIEKHEHYSSAWLASADKVNQSVLDGYSICRTEADNKTHFFNGRFENIYIKAKRIPALKKILHAADNIACNILNVKHEQLRSGYWFNEMHKGDITTRHNHKDDDEVLSCVYYLKVLQGAGGELFLWINNEKIRIKPEPGMFVFFDPALDHEVSEQTGSGLRLSLGMNFGGLLK